jgi:hypothetical protein
VSSEGSARFSSATSSVALTVNPLGTRGGFKFLMTGYSIGWSLAIVGFSLVSMGWLSCH